MTEVGNLTQRIINEDSGVAVTSSALHLAPGLTAPVWGCLRGAYM